MKEIFIAVKKTFSKLTEKVLGVTIFLNALFIYYFIFLKTTTWEVFWRSNLAIYNIGQIVLTLVTAVLIAISFSMFVYVSGQRQKKHYTQGAKINTFFSFLFSAAATGCPVCGAFLLPILGVAASLTALPLAGLEIKLLSIALLFYVIYQYTKNISGRCEIPKQKVIAFTEGQIELNITKKTLPQLKSFGLLLLFILVIYALPRLPNRLKIDVRKVKDTQALANSENAPDAIFSQINPKDGYVINAQYGDVGPKMIDAGVIDLVKFKQIYEKSGQPLTDEQLKILTQGSKERVKISPENSYFLLNFFWAYGLANKTKILTEGDMVKYGDGQTGNFASTGGWTLSKEEAMKYYAKSSLTNLTDEQESLVNKVASNIYRPCCNNSTAFPDCNHGMALLGILELMAGYGAGESEMYKAAKYISAFWFPSNYYDLALYFKNKEGKDFKDIDPKILLSKDYSSVSGWQNIKNWLSQKGIVKPPPKTGGGCGV